MPNRIWRPDRTPTPTVSCRLAVPQPMLSPVFLKWIGSRLAHKAFLLGPVGQQLLGEYFSCGSTQPGKMRIVLPRLLSVMSGEHDSLLVHTQRGGEYVATPSETATLLREIETGITAGLAAKRGEDRLTVQELGMLAGEFYSRNRNGHNPAFMTFLGAIEDRLQGKLFPPVDFYIGAGIAFRQRAPLSSITDYIDAVARKCGFSEPNKKLELSKRVSYVIVDKGFFDPSLPAGIVKHYRFDAAQAGRMAAYIFLERGEGVGKTEHNALLWLDRTGYHAEQTADFLAELVKALGYDTAQTAKLVAEAAKNMNIRSAEATAQLLTRMNTSLGYGQSQAAQFTAWLARHDFFPHKRG